MLAIVFPGQGSQTIGMGLDFARAHPESAAAFEEGERAFGGGLLEPSQNPERAPEGGIVLDPEDIGLGRYTGESLDFGGVILEILALAWPMQPRESDRCPEGCPRWQRPERAAEGDKKIRPFAGLDLLLQARRKAAGRGEE